MSRTQQVRVLAALSVVLAVVFVRAWRHSPMAQPATPEVLASDVGPPDETTLPDLLSRTLPSALRGAQRDAVGQMKLGRDPFVRGQGSGSHGLSLSGILWDGQHPMAVINNQTMRVGESVDGYTVVAIGQDVVSVTDGTQTIQLRLAP